MLLTEAPNPSLVGSALVLWQAWRRPERETYTGTLTHTTSIKVDNNLAKRLLPAGWAAANKRGAADSHLARQQFFISWSLVISKLHALPFVLGYVRASSGGNPSCSVPAFEGCELSMV